jgi:hypothetical protein
MTSSTVSNNSTGAGSGGGDGRFGWVDGGSGGDGGDGGGIYNTGILTITNSTVSGNKTSDGGSGGSGGYYGGGGGCGGHGGHGSGIYNIGTLILTHNTISDNITGDGGLGGGSEDEEWYPRCDGQDGLGGGIYNNGTVELSHTIVAGQSTGGDCAGKITDGILSIGHNIDSDNSCNLVDLSDLPGLDPTTQILLGPLADNGGAAQTHALLKGSLAIDTGDNASCPQSDQRGVIRPLDGLLAGAAICDIGAFELFAILGDFDDDGAVTYDDFYNHFLPAYGTHTDDPGFAPECDLNQDGSIDMLDYTEWYVYYMNAYPGSLTVTIKPQKAIDNGAQWRLVGGPNSSWHDSQDIIEFPGVGPYTVVFKDIYGWKTPANQIIELTEGAPSGISGTYVQLGSITVNIGPSAAVNEGGQWQLTDGPDNSWHGNGDTIDNLNVGTYTVVFKDIYGWQTPANQLIEITEGATIEISGTYTFIPRGSVTVNIGPPGAFNEGAQWRLTDGPDTSWHDSGDTIEDIIVSNYTIIFKDIDGWGKLLDKQITVVEGSTTDISVTYRSLKSLIQLTDNDYDDTNPSLNPDGQVVWSGSDGHDFEIFLYDGTTIIQLTDNDYDDKKPQINPSGYVVWEGSGERQYDICLYDGTSITQIGHGRNPQINSSGIVVWEGSYDIFLYDGTSTTQLTDTDWDEVDPQINSNGHVVWWVWNGHPSGWWPPFLYDGTSITQIYDFDAMEPKINSSGNVIWIGPSPPGIFLYDGTSVTKLSEQYSPYNGHQINDSGFVVWLDLNQYFNETEIFLYDGTSIIRLTENDYDGLEPQIDPSGQVVWAGLDGQDYEIFLYDGKIITQITDNFYADRGPQISPNGHVVWQGSDGNDFEIFLVKPM